LASKLILFASAFFVNQLLFGGVIFVIGFDTSLLAANGITAESASRRRDVVLGDIFQWRR